MDATGRVCVIAEIGSSHDGNLAVMRRMVGAAAKAGADVVKAQWVSDPAALCRRRNAPEFLVAYGLLAFDPSWHLALWRECEEQGVKYMATCYVPEDIKTVALFVHAFKVASFESGDRAFLRRHYLYDRPVYISTGLCEAADLSWLVSQRKKHPQIKLLHCTSAYPAPPGDLNLAAIRTYGLDGYSDHSGRPSTGALAVAAGARIIEVHFRIQGADPTHPDFPHSLDEGQLGEYIARIREAEEMLGDGVKRVMPSEEPLLRFRVRP